MTGAWRRHLLIFSRLGGSAHRRLSRGWGLVLGWVTVAAVGLLVLPAVVNFAFGLVPDDAWDAFQAGDPRLGDVWSIWSVLGVAGTILALRWLVEARSRVVVEGFVDYTKDDEQAVKGLATLLIAELSRLHELYGRVNDELSTPMSVGVQTRGGTGPGTQAGQFLSVSADEVEQTLNDAIATEATVSLGGVKLPIGFVLSVIGRIARGPRVIGSLHYTDASGGPTLTAQLVGRGKPLQWRVDGAASAEAADKAFLDPMVSELAARMFNDLVLRGSVRWRAIRSFTEYLELYWESYRTPRDRAAKLEAAEGKLLEAIAEDEGFDLAYYNLGVVYSQLADTERAAAERSEYVKKSDRPLEAYEARIDAALAAFNKAVALNRERAEAVYALAVHEYTRMGRCDRGVLDAVVCRCDRVLELQPDHAQALDLKGIALRGLGRIEDSEASHRKAVARSWRRLWRTEFEERSSPPATDSMLPGARANLATALRNLARAEFEAGRDEPERLAHADELFDLACDLATGDTKAATLWAHGVMLEDRGLAARARERYDAALKIDPENPVYWACLASAHALGAEPASELAAQARRFAESALGDLAPIYRSTLELHHSHASVALRENTIDALARAYTNLRDAAGVVRMERLRALRAELEDATSRRDAGLLLAIKARYGAGREWELEQVQIALARTFGREGRWTQAAAEYASLIALLERARPAGVVQHSLHAKHARALRNDGRRQAALAAAARGQLQAPLSACARREVGKAHFALLQFEEALEAWKQTLWLTPNDPYLHWKVAFCHWCVAQDRRDEAARRASLLEAAAGFDRAGVLFGVQMAEGWAWSQLWAGRVRQELGELDAAVRHLRSAAGCAPTEVAGALLLGELLASLEEYDASRVQLQRVLASVRKPNGAQIDADWGETIVDHQAVERAEAALGSPPLAAVRRAA